LLYWILHSYLRLVMEKKGIIGLGKLGICFALNLEAAGYEVIGVDVNEKLVQQINDKSHRSFEPGVEEMLKTSSRFSATTDMKRLLKENVNLIFVVVATPSLPGGGYDHSQLDEVAEKLLHLNSDAEDIDLVIMATSMPGYCNQLAQKMGVGNFHISYNPEFIAQGNIIYNQQYPDQVLIGEASELSGDRIESVYRKICKNDPHYCRMDRLSAEITKLATNCFLTTKISFANSIGDLASKAGADPDKILSAVGADSRIGDKYLKYGFGYGGPCFPRDNHALIRFAENTGQRLPISEATDQVNRDHLDYQLNEWLSKYPPGETISFHQLTYKPGTVLLVESQQLALALKLAEAGRRVLIIEQPEVIRQLKEQYAELFDYEEIKS